MKRILSVILICALLVAGLAVVASAAPASITIDAQKTDDVVTAQIKLNGYEADSWSAMTTLVTYNSNALTFSNAESVMEGMQVESTAAGKLLLCWIADPLTVPADGVVATLTFDINEGAENEEITLGTKFVEEGMALKGETTPIENPEDAPIFSTKEETVVIQPEVIEPEEPDEPQDPEEPTSNKATVTTTKAPDNKVDINVKGKYDDSGEVDNYKIVISWDEMTYSYADELNWNPGEHKWELAETGAKWGTINPKKITITNHSSESITATASYEETLAGTDFIFGETNGTEIASAEGTAVNNAPKNEIAATFKPNGAVITDWENPTSLGTIKITIA